MAKSNKDIPAWIKAIAGLFAIAIGGGTLGICAPAWQTRAQAATEHRIMRDDNRAEHQLLQNQINEQYREILRRLPEPKDR